MRRFEDMDHKVNSFSVNVQDIKKIGDIKQQLNQLCKGKEH